MNRTRCKEYQEYKEYKEYKNRADGRSKLLAGVNARGLWAAQNELVRVELFSVLRDQAWAGKDSATWRVDHRPHHPGCEDQRIDQRR